MTHVASLLAALLVALWPAAASANGGTLQVSGQRAGPYELSVFTDPSPITTGYVDVSVMVQTPTGDLVQDAEVVVRAKPAGEPGDGTEYAATHELATNKLFYAAHVDVPTAGQWEFDVAVSGSEGSGAVEFAAEVTEPSALDNSALILLVTASPVIVLAVWWLTRARPGSRGG